MNRPEVYFQFPDGDELELEVLVPDPPDGTFTCFLPEGCDWADLPVDGWIRIVP